MKDISKIKAKIRDIRDFPKEGIIFKDITPLLAEPQLCREVVKAFAEATNEDPPDAIAGIESRGFLFGMMLAEFFNVPFIPIRKLGKLPFDKISHSYSLEYGEATIEIHTDAIQPGARVMIHDDLLATGGTAAAASHLIEKLRGEVHSYTFLIELDFLEGRNLLARHRVISLIHY